MFTASHNPAQYNGMKMCRAGAQPIGTDTGLADIAASVSRGGLDRAASRRQRQPSRTSSRRTPPTSCPSRRSTGRKLKVVIDAGNGMAGLTAPDGLRAARGRPDRGRADVLRARRHLPQPRGQPHRAGQPRRPAEAGPAVGADIGLAFDGDADRCFLVDEQGEAVSPSTLTALIAARELAKEPGSTIIHNLITSRAVPELVTELGGKPVRTRVGHSYIKATMAETGAIFGGEHSGHFYFRDFWKADSGMLAALHALAALAETDAAAERPAGGVRALCRQWRDQLDGRRPGEHRRRPREQFADPDGVTTDRLDGLTVSHVDWWFNVRPSNTEPLLRLNAEGRDRATMQRVRDEVLTIIRSAS